MIQEQEKNIATPGFRKISAFLSARVDINFNRCSEEKFALDQLSFQGKESGTPINVGIRNGFFSDNIVEEVQKH